MARKNKAVQGEEPVEFVEEPTVETKAVVEKAPEISPAPVLVDVPEVPTVFGQQVRGNADEREIDQAWLDEKFAASDGIWFGGNIKFVEDVTIPDGKYLGAHPSYKTTFNLNGHTVTLGNYAVFAYGSLTIKDDSAEKTGRLFQPNVNPDANSYCAVQIGYWDRSTGAHPYDNVVLTVESGTVESAQSGVFVWGSNQTVLVNGGAIKANTAFCISGNGSSKEIEGVKTFATENAKFTVNGGEVISGDTAIYQPNSGVTKIAGGSVIGAYSAICARAGLVVTEGGKIVKTTPVNVQKKAVRDGTIGTDEGALVAVSTNYPSGNPSAELDGGEFVNEDGGDAIVIGVDPSTPTAEKPVASVSTGVLQNITPPMSEEQMEEMGVDIVPEEDVFIKKGKELLGMDAGDDPEKDETEPLTDDEVDAIEKHAAQYGESKPA